MTKKRRNRDPERAAQEPRDPSPGPGPHTLAIDIGGTALKTSVLDRGGRMAVERVRLPTPYPCPPKALLSALVKLTAPLPSFDRISIGFPGVVRGGYVVTAPHFGTKAWRGYPLAAALARRLRRPARLLNDAEVQGLGIVAGRGLEVVLTLGTGIGSAVFADGRLAPHLELSQHPLHNGETYNEYAGVEALRRHGKKKWNRRVLKTIGIVDSLLHYDVLYLGGGNAQHLTLDLPQNVRIASNDNGITGGIHLWDEAVWQHVRGDPPRKDAPEHRRTQERRPPSAGAGKPDSPMARRPDEGKHAITRAGHSSAASPGGARRLARRRAPRARDR